MTIGLKKSYKGKYPAVRGVCLEEKLLYRKLFSEGMLLYDISISNSVSI